MTETKAKSPKKRQPKPKLALCPLCQEYTLAASTVFANHWHCTDPRCGWMGVLA